MRILCLHGYRQNAQGFREKTGAFRKSLKKQCEFVFMDAPHELPEGKLEGADKRGWWYSRPDQTFAATEPSDFSSGLEESVASVAEAFETQGPFDGVLAFSQGAAFAFILCALKERQLLGWRHPFDFMILVSAFRSLSSAHAEYYAAPLETPTLVVYGETDQVIPEKMTEELLPFFKNATELRHPGGHFVPINATLKPGYTDFLTRFREDGAGGSK